VYDATEKRKCEMKTIKNICMFMAGPAIVALLYYASGAPWQRYDGMAVAVTLGLTLGVVFVCFGKLAEVEGWSK